METQSSSARLAQAVKRHKKSALAVAAAVLALSLIARAQQSHPTYDTGEPIYGDGPIYDTTIPPTSPLSPDALSALSTLQYLRSVVDRAPDLPRTRKAVALGEIDLALFSLQQSNAPDAASAGQSHPTYDSARIPGGSRPIYDTHGPIYDNTAPAAPAVAYDTRSAATALHQLGVVIAKSTELDNRTRATASQALEAAAKELESRSKR